MSRLPATATRVPDRTAAELRCSVVIIQDQSVLLLHRSWRDHDPTHGDWVLPGGSPRPTEGTAACARREAREETGLEVHIGRCLFVLEVTSAPPDPRRTVELVFSGTVIGGDAPRTMEPFRHAQFVPLDELGSLRLRPPLAGHLRGLAHHRAGEGAAYLGNLWRPDSPEEREQDDVVELYEVFEREVAADE